MKVKDLKFGINSGECGLAQFCKPSEVVSYRFFFIEKRSPRSYYVYAQLKGDAYPKAYYRVSANADVTDVIREVLS